MTNAPNISRYLEHTPELGQGCFLHPSAQVIGDVILGDDVSVWCNAVIRGDVNAIRIGAGTNVQDLSMLHVSHRNAENPNGADLRIGSYVTIGHQVILHGCHIGDECLIGMGSIIMDKAVLGNRVMLGAGSLVPAGRQLLEGHLYLGRPATLVRALSAEEISFLRYSAEHYVRVKNNYLAVDRI